MAMEMMGKLATAATTAALDYIANDARLEEPAETSASSSPEVTLATPKKPWTMGLGLGEQPSIKQHSPVDKRQL
jgi:hypothetical protein